MESKIMLDPYHRAAFVTVLNSDRKLRSVREQFEFVE